MKTQKISSSDSFKIKDLFLLQPEFFADHRGENFEGYNEKHYDEIFSSSSEWKNGNNRFIVDSFSKSKKNRTKRIPRRLKDMEAYSMP